MTNLEGLQASCRVEGTEIVLELAGNADHRTCEQLRELCTHVHAEALAAGVRAAVVDLRQLEFMNSSCFKALVTWVSDIQDLEPDRRYKIRALSNPAIPWQKRSLQSLQYFAVDLVTVIY